LFFEYTNLVYAEAVNIKRLEGQTRYETAVEISKSTFPNGTATIVLVTGSDYPDALSGSPLAYKLNAPILLTERDQLPSVTLNEIKRLGASKVVILGGQAVIFNKIEDYFKQKNLEVERIAGKNRFETSSLIASKIDSNKAIIASGENFPDALSVAPFAAQQQIPILLTSSNKLSEEIRTEVRQESIILGGVNAIGESVASNLKNVTRISGKDRYETNLKITNFFNKELENAYISTGINFADALTGSILAARNNGALLLSNQQSLPLSSQVYLKTKNTSHITVLGGDTAVPYQVENDITEINNLNYFVPSTDNLAFLDYGSNYFNAGQLKTQAVYKSNGMVDNKFASFQYGNSLGLVDISKIRTNLTFEEILTISNHTEQNINKSILINNSVTVKDSIQKSTSIASLTEGQRIPIVSEDPSYYYIRIAGKVGAISKNDAVLDKGIPVLMYHHILRNEENNRFRNTSTTITDKEFYDQMKLLKSDKFSTITINDLELFLTKKRNLPSKAIILTFDDGLKSVYKYAYPILKEYQFQASEFIITERIPSSPVPFNPDDLQFLSWQEMNAMSDVFEFHSHTHAMHHLSKDNKGYLLVKNRDEVKSDILMSKTIMNNTPYFVYPFGHYNQSTIQILKELDFRISFTTQYGKVTLGDDLLQLKRIGIPPGISLNEFASKIKN
jgi:putative cell wall-binding protein/peptidoglycan/xylan/chitin deacetylase (PgdA/CDA1 family)